MSQPGSASADQAEAPESTKPGRAELDGVLNSASLGYGANGAPANPAVENAANGAARSLISTGNVALRSTDVAKARFDVQKVVDRYRGEVSQEQTETDDEGDVNRSRLVVRIPTADFADAMESLETAADLISSDTNTDDVTTKVIDNKIRVRVQRRSIARIELLLDRAQSIRDIVNIEGQLSSRQARLGSLERQQAYLADQTAMSTITISLERTKDTKAEKRTDATGFAAGLESGWDNLKSLTIGLLTVLGAVLPFAVVMLLLAIPGWLLLRRLQLLQRRAPTPEPDPVG